MKSSASAPLGSWHGVADGDVRFGIGTWFGDVLVRFGYDLFEHEHPWDGEWIDDAFETAAIDLRATVAKLLRVLDEIDADDIDVERTPLRIDLALAYLDRIRQGVAVAVPCCFGTDGRALVSARTDPNDMATAVASLDSNVARALDEIVGLDLTVVTHDPDLYRIVDAGGARPPLPKAMARTRDASASTTASAIAELDAVLHRTCRAYDGVLLSLQHAIAHRAEDGPELLERWARTDWAVIGPATKGASDHLPLA